jgi:hypothetical protein
VIASESDHRISIEAVETATMAAAIAAYGPRAIGARSVRRLI